MKGYIDPLLFLKYNGKDICPYAFAVCSTCKSNPSDREYEAPVNGRGLTGGNCIYSVLSQEEIKKGFDDQFLFDMAQERRRYCM